MNYSNEDAALCARCGGDCCLTRPGIEEPERFTLMPDPVAALSAGLASGVLTIEVHYGKPYTPGITTPEPGCIIYYPRPSRYCECTVAPPDGVPADACHHLTTTGCRLPFEQRPRACRALTPQTDFNCQSDWGRREAALAWFTHQDIILAAIAVAGSTPHITGTKEL